VSKIDLRQGRATLETSVGQLELATAPAELQALQTGDVLTLCIDPTALPDTSTSASSRSAKHAAGTDAVVSGSGRSLMTVTASLLLLREGEKL